MSTLESVHKHPFFRQPSRTRKQYHQDNHRTKLMYWLFRAKYHTGVLQYMIKAHDPRRYNTQEKYTRYCLKELKRHESHSNKRKIT